ncbi:MAG: 50S ribosomal protein L35 [Dehalococcoidia bacterium]|nr:50S ribosomal protein L35 [Dehalococcoidia bacterium]
MPKIKTHKGARARLAVTGTGKIMRMKIGKSHLRRKKPKRVKRLYSDTIPLSPTAKKAARRLLPGI